MNHIKQLTFLRFIAAITIVIYHFGKNTDPFSASALKEILNQGSIAVSFFFFLSGVVLALNYFEKPKLNKKAFYLKRFARIYPVYILAFIVTICCITLFNNAYPKGGSILLQVFSLQAWVPGICLDINFPAWSISVEIFFYLIFPFVLIFFKRLSFTKTAVLVGVFWMLSILQHGYFTDEIYVLNNPEIGDLILYFPLWHLNAFLFGILCAMFIISQKTKHTINFNRYRLLYSIGIITLIVLLGSDNFIRPYAHNGLMSPIFFMIIAGLALDKSAVTNSLSLKPLLLLGHSSYALYIFQWPIFIIVRNLTGTETLDGAHFYLYLILLILVSILIYHYFEKVVKDYLIRKFL